MIDNILISLSFVFLARNMNYNEINDLTFKSDRLLEPRLPDLLPGTVPLWALTTAIAVLGAFGAVLGDRVLIGPGVPVTVHSTLACVSLPFPRE